MSGVILVTGASGFLGRHLLQALRNLGENAIGHTRQDGDLARDRIAHSNVRHVYHLAARTFVPDSWADPRAFYESNVLGTANVCEFCRETGASLTLMSSYVYGQPATLPIPEDHPLQPFNPYAHSKILAENIATYYAETFHVPLTIVRGFNLYGPAQPNTFLIPTLIAQAISPNTEHIEVADSRPRRDFIYIDDAVDLLLRLHDLSPPARVYNAGSGTSISVRELADMISRIAGARKPLRALEQERPGEVPDVVADISRARRDLAWTPTVPLEEGLRRTIAWLASHTPYST